MGIKKSKHEVIKNLQDKEMQREKLERRRLVKMLLYGTGECGKTTILRQMMLIHSKENPKIEQSLTKEYREMRGAICFNVIEGAAFTATAASSKFNIKISDPQAIEAATFVLNAYEELIRSGKSSSANLNSFNLVASIVKMYKDPDFKKVFERSSEYQIHDGWFYYAEMLTNEYPTWGGSEWIPNKVDLLNSRIRTTGINEVRFYSDGIKYQLIDIGGQQSERKKFFKLFTQIDCVLYVTSLSEYDQRLYENESTNRLAESVTVFGNTVNHADFKSTWFLLFLNKYDLFQEKYYRKHIPIRLHFPYEENPPRWEDEADEKCELAQEWYRQLYRSKISEKKLEQVKMFITTALDEKNMQRVMDVSTTILMSKNIGTLQY